MVHGENKTLEELFTDGFDEEETTTNDLGEDVDADETDDEEEFDGGTEEDTPTEESELERLRRENEEIRKENEENKKAKDESYKEGQKLNWVNKVYADKFSFLKLYESDKKLAEKVLDHVGEERSPEELYIDLRKEKFGDNDPALQKMEIMRELEQKEIKKEFGRMIKEKGIDLKSKEGKEFMEEYNFITDNGKKTTIDNMETLFNKSIKLSGIETLREKKDRIDSELPVGQSRRNIKKPAPKKSLLDSFAGKEPSEWYK